MTATAEPKTEARSTTGRYSFQMCDCDPETPHGYFHLPNGRKSGPNYLSKSDVLKVLEEFVATGQIPQDQKSTIEEDIRLTNLPDEISTLPGEVSPNMITMLLGIIAAPRNPDPDGTHAFNTRKKRGGKIVGRFSAYGQWASDEVTTKMEAYRLVGIVVNNGYVSEADERTLRAQIANSGLPD